jgi:Flp pilus assembly protein TadD
MSCAIAGPDCTCGSRLAEHHCCGLDHSTLRAPGADAGGQLHATVSRARQAHARGDVVTAEALCLAILAQSPGEPEALWILSRLRLAQGRIEAVVALVRRILAINPGDVRATQDLALRVMTSGAAIEAEKQARAAVRMAPFDPQSHVVMGMVLTEALKPQTAEVHYRRALALSGQRDPIVLANFALCLRMQGRLAEARALYEESHAAAPQEFQILFDWAKLEEADRQFTRAEDLITQADRLAPGHAGLRLLRAVLLSRQDRPRAALDLLGDGDAATLGADGLLFKGRLLDRLGRTDAAFAAFDAARAAGKPVYEAAAAARLADRLRGFFTAAHLASLPRAPRHLDQPQPVFILGFPRSGTTLVEQTLTATQAIAAGGELPLVWELTHAMPRLLDSPLSYPDALAELWMGDKTDALETLRDHYLRRARQFGIGPAPSRFTDKMPLNEMHLGLIGLLFPDAPLIHVIRHPLDVVLSVYANRLTHGFHCAASLDSAARHYALIADLVDHYRAQMRLNYLAVRYEDLVLDQETQVRRMLEFVGVTFEAAHLRFHENPRRAPTASYAQVTEKLHDRALGRWRRYRVPLAPIIPILRPVIERLGYDCD